MPDYAVVKTEYPKNMLFIERLEWGPFVGTIKSYQADGADQPFTSPDDPKFLQAHNVARDRWAEIRHIERDQIGTVNYYLDRERLGLRKIELKSGKDSAVYKAAQEKSDTRSAELQKQYDQLAAKAQALREQNARAIWSPWPKSAGARRQSSWHSSCVFMPPTT